MPLMNSKSPEAFKHNLKAEMKAGKPMAQSLAIAYAQKRKARKMAEGGNVDPEYFGRVADETDGGESRTGQRWAEDSKKSAMTPYSPEYKHDQETKMRGWAEEYPEFHYAHGGDIVDKVMRKHYSEGGKVSNGGEDELSHLADGDPNNFDDLALRDDLEGTNSGAADGDFLGDAQEDEDRHDIVSRVMRQRSMKQRNPRPA